MTIDFLAAAEKLAVVSDFDGTLAPFAVDRYAVKAHPVALEALERLARMNNTWAAILSGRDLTGLRQVCPTSGNVILGGSHGAETSGQESALSPEAAEHLANMETQVRALLTQYPGAEIEVKSYQVVLHVRALQIDNPAAAADALSAAARIDTDGYPFTLGNAVAEFSVTQATKGSWLTDLRTRTGATLVFLGDDRTDEDGFAALHQPPEVGVKIGDGSTLAHLRLPDSEAAAQWLSDLATARAALHARAARDSRAARHSSSARHSPV